MLTEVSQAPTLPYSDVEEVVSFYTMFYGDKVGEFVLEVCKTVPCAILGADEIIEYIGEKLGIQAGQTTPDGLFTLLRVECLAGCHRAPVMQVNSRYYENLTTQKVDELIDLMRCEARMGRQTSEKPPAPTAESVPSLTSQTVKATIDGKPVDVPAGTLVWEAAQQVDSDIPIFCYHSKLGPVGVCRMCMVEIEGQPKLTTACTTGVTEGMVVHTDHPM